ncbi:hypothetical protein J2Z77_003106 [Streptomyces avidinii]|uniref:Uncharacterized protein n=1 Tax=Streptomyces avidinii TaxID=1895 RepID=A0ABS4L5D1_STRAV|nr:hypothetical protein [Streptomyces avidinii]
MWEALDAVDRPAQSTAATDAEVRAALDVR